MCGGGPCGIQPPIPRASCSFLLLSTTFCYFLLPCTAFDTFCYFCLLFANTHSQTHPPTANAWSSCTHPVPERLYHVWGWPCGMQPPIPRASFNFLLLFATFAYFCLLLPTFAYFCLLLPRFCQYPLRSCLKASKLHSMCSMAGLQHV